MIHSDELFEKNQEMKTACLERNRLSMSDDKERRLFLEVPEDYPRLKFTNHPSDNSSEFNFTKKINQSMNEKGRLTF